MDFKFELWQLELHPDSRYFTVLHANNKLYCYTIPILRVKPTQSELNAALKPIFRHILHVFFIHDDLVIASEPTS